MSHADDELEKAAEKSVNRNLYALHEADSRVHWFKLGAQFERSRLLPIIKEMQKALQFYSTKTNEMIDRQIEWRPHACDSYSGTQYAPDWDGDMQDEPGEIAQKALASVDAKLKSMNIEL